jgi:hypothetical protein
MPYPGIPAGKKTAKMESCIKQVMARGMDKSRAIAICHSRIMKKEKPMTEEERIKYRKERAERTLETKAENEGLAATARELHPIIEPAMGEEGYVETEKDWSEPVAYKPLGGATSFSELDEVEAAREAASEVRELGWNVVDLVGNIVDSPDVEDKVSAIKTVAEEFGKRLKKETALNKVKNFVTNLFVKKSDTGSSFTVFKDLQDNYRYLAVVSNKYRDLDKDILTEESHKEFEAYLDANPDKAPSLWIWHTPLTAHKNKADLWAYENGFMIYSGKLEKEEAEVAIKASENYNLGMSHGLFVDQRNPQSEKEITQYRTFEISYLPLERAANPWTAYSVISKEVDNMKKDKLEFLEFVLGKDRVAELLKDTEKQKAVLDALGVDSKETTEKVEQPAEAPVATVKVETTPLVADAVVKEVLEKIGVDKMSSFLENLQTAVEGLKADNETMKKALETANAEIATLKKSDDQKIAEQIVPPVSPYAWMKSLSKSDSTVLDPTNPEDAKLKEDTPKPSWLSGALKPLV